MVFSRFLSILLPFKPSLTAYFPSIPELSVAIYVVRKQSVIGIGQRGSTVISLHNDSALHNEKFLPKTAKEVGIIM